MPRVLSAIAAVAVAAVLAGPAVGSGRPTPPAPVVVQTRGGGFAWGDAAIGAAAALGLVLALSGVLFLKGDRNDS
jgi:hypothetical protein